LLTARRERRARARHAAASRSPRPRSPETLNPDHGKSHLRRIVELDKGVQRRRLHTAGQIERRDATAMHRVRVAARRAAQRRRAIVHEQLDEVVLESARINRYLSALQPIALPLGGQIVNAVQTHAQPIVDVRRVNEAVDGRRCGDSIGDGERTAGRLGVRVHESAHLAY